MKRGEPIYTRTIQVPVPIYEASKLLAKHMGMSLNRFIVHALQCRLGKESNASIANPGLGDSATRKRRGVQRAPTG